MVSVRDVNLVVFDSLILVVGKLVILVLMVVCILFLKFLMLRLMLKYGLLIVVVKLIDNYGFWYWVRKIVLEFYLVSMLKDG